MGDIRLRQRNHAILANTNPSDHTFYDHESQIGVYGSTILDYITPTSSNGTWSKSGSNPVLTLGGGGTWDDEAILDPRIIQDGVTYKMWYTGHDGTIREIGLATSTDGTTWVKDAGNPVLKLGAGGTWDDNIIGYQCIIKEQTTYKMWYAGHDGTTWRIGYATSPDGITWTKDTGNPVLSEGAGGAWDDNGIGDTCVINDNGTYKMWYAGNDGTTWRIGYATSSDGITWTKSASNPVLSEGAAATWDSGEIWSPSVIKLGTNYYLFYTGATVVDYGIGLATSTDGITWTKDAGNPVISEGVGGSWDDDSIGTCTIIKNGNQYYLYYDANDGAKSEIGLATMDI